jgi:hypothetical protein
MASFIARCLLYNKFRLCIIGKTKPTATDKSRISESKGNIIKDKNRPDNTLDCLTQLA